MISLRLYYSPNLNIYKHNIVAFNVFFKDIVNDIHSKYGWTKPEIKEIDACHAPGGVHALEDLTATVGIPPGEPVCLNL